MALLTLIVLIVSRTYLAIQLSKNGLTIPRGHYLIYCRSEYFSGML